MLDYMNIGSSPVEESCAQVGSDDYEHKSQVECMAFKHQLERLFPDGVFRIKSFPHDGMEVGSIIYYKEIVAWFDPDRKENVDAAYAAEANTPMRWDEQAIEELKQGGIVLS